MNEQGKKSLIRVAEWLEAGAPHVVVVEGIELGIFDMEYAVSTSQHVDFDGKYDETCGTACCVAGAVCQFEVLGERQGDGEMEFFGDEGAGVVAQEYLGITEEQADKLFTPWSHFSYEFDSDFSSPKRAAAVIRHFIATGVVDWDKFDEDGKEV